VFDDAISQFAVAYADQTERDYQALVDAVRKGQKSAQGTRAAAAPGLRFIGHIHPGRGLPSLIGTDDPRICLAPIR